MRLKYSAIIPLMLLLTLTERCHITWCAQIPPEWVVYIQHLIDKLDSLGPERLNQILQPPELDRCSIQGNPNVYQVCLPHVLLWNPLCLLQRLLPQSSENAWNTCPIKNCISRTSVHRWNTGSSAGHSPRLIHDIDSIVLLVPVLYTCELGHEVLGTDPRILALFPEEEYIPFILFYRSGVMRRFALKVINLTIEGLSFSTIERFIKSQRQQMMTSLKLKAVSMMQLHCINLSGDLKTIGESQYPDPTNDLLCKCFLTNFIECKQFYFSEMASLSSSKYISIDHTFKVTANIGYLRPDGKWVTQYNSLFIVLNDIGQVIAWQFTKTTSIDECETLLLALRDRCKRLGKPIKEVYLDNCCTSRNKIQSIFGKDVSVYLDIFHAAQRITKTISKRHPLCHAVMKNIKLLFRDPLDIGILRTLPTPSKDVLLKNIETFLQKWTDASIDGWYILTEKTKKEIKSIQEHVKPGCLSSIDPCCGTNKNENLHKNINPFFSRCRMGIPLALALLTVLFHHHNLKHSCTDDTTSSILSAKAKYGKISETTLQPEEFGIVSKTDIADTDSWIFASKVSIPTQIDWEQMAEIAIPSELDNVCTFDDLASLLQSSINLYQLTSNIQLQSKYTPMLNLSMIPFMSSVSCLFEANPNGEQEEHDERLSRVVKSWGFTMHPIRGDGNCCFAAVASSLLYHQQFIEQKYPSLFESLKLNVATVEDIAQQLRYMAVDEWTKNSADYQGFLPNGYSVETEAEKFKDLTYFFGPLGNTMIKAISNSLHMPIIVFSSALHYPVVYTTPRNCKSSIPVYVAFNQGGAGHYSAVSLIDEETVQQSFISPHPATDQQLNTRPSRCTCGHNDKRSTSKRCVSIKTKYTFIVRCSCLLANKSCNSFCLCFNCNNPNGTRPPIISQRLPEKRSRPKHAWQIVHSKSSIYAHHLNEKILQGPCTQLEYLLLSQIIQFLDKDDDINSDLSLIPIVFNFCTQLLPKFGLSLPLGQKTPQELQSLIKNYLRNFSNFKALCKLQVLSNTASEEKL